MGNACSTEISLPIIGGVITSPISITTHGNNMAFMVPLESRTPNIVLVTNPSVRSGAGIWYYTGQYQGTRLIYYPHNINGSIIKYVECNQRLQVRTPSGIYEATKGSEVGEVRYQPIGPINTQSNGVKQEIPSPVDNSIYSAWISQSIDDIMLLELAEAWKKSPCKSIRSVIDSSDTLSNIIDKKY